VHMRRPRYPDGSVITSGRLGAGFGAGWIAERRGRSIRVWIGWVSSLALSHHLSSLCSRQAATRRDANSTATGLYRRATVPGRLGAITVLARPICGVPDGGSDCVLCPMSPSESQSPPMCTGARCSSQMQNRIMAATQTKNAVVPKVSNTHVSPSDMPRSTGSRMAQTRPLASARRKSMGSSGARSGIRRSRQRQRPTRTPIETNITGHPSSAPARNIPTNIKGAAIATQTRKATRQKRLLRDAGRLACRNSITARTSAWPWLKVRRLAEKAIRRELSIPGSVTRRRPGARLWCLQCGKGRSERRPCDGPSSPMARGRPNGPEPSDADCCRRFPAATPNFMTTCRCSIPATGVRHDRTRVGYAIRARVPPPRLRWPEPNSQKFPD
jgi:hypothetical protein